MIAMSYSDFLQLWNKAREMERTEFVNTYIDAVHADNPEAAEQSIRMIARLAVAQSFKAVRSETGLSQFMFAKYYGLSLAFVQRREATGLNNNTRGLLPLLAYAVIVDIFNT